MTTGDIVKVETSCDCIVVTAKNITLSSTHGSRVSSTHGSRVALGVVIDRSDEREGEQPTQKSRCEHVDFYEVQSSGQYSCRESSGGGITDPVAPDNCSTVPWQQ